MQQLPDQKPQPCGNVRVVVRFRPLNDRQKHLSPSIIHELYDNKSVVIKQHLKPDKPQIHSFNFDRTFDMNATQEEVYTYAAKPVVDSVLEGFNGTVFAYGQTASGKTHTMEGSAVDGGMNAGIIPRMIKHVFDSIENSPDNIQFRIKVSMVQLYMQKLRDLLDISKCDLKIRSQKSKGIFLQDLTQNYISDPDEVFDMMKVAQVNRTICATNMNERSSRSHMIVILSISQNNLADLSAKTGKLYLVDLAGSERVGKTGAEGKTLDQARKINLSLSTLGKVINALTDGKSTHVPYRDSKLTRVLQESLGGNSKTTLIVTCSPHQCNLSETLSALRFGVSAKNIKNKPKINREFTVAELQMLLEKAQAKLAEKDRFILRLEQYIKVQLKAKIPFGNSSDISHEVSIDDDKLRAMENELELQRTNSMNQADKINSLMTELMEITVKSEQLERLNSVLQEKVSNLEVNAESYKSNQYNINFLLLTKINEMTNDANIKRLLVPYIKSQEGLQILPSTHQTLKSPVLQQTQQNIETQKQTRKKSEEQAKTEKDLKRKILNLENNIEQLTTVYYDLYVQQSKWKVENAMNLRRIEKKNQLISSMQDTITDLRYQLEHKQRYDEDQDNNEQLKQLIRSKDIRALKQFAHSKLVKPVRGGKPKP